jgi:hypothetical protein
MTFDKITELTPITGYDDFEYGLARNLYINKTITDLNTNFKDLTLGGDYYYFGFKATGPGSYGVVNILGTVGVGINNDANPYFSTIVGYNATIAGGTGGLYESSVNGATLIGNGAYHRPFNGNGIAIGRSCITDSFGVAIGTSTCSITGSRSIAIGSRNTFVVGDFSITMGGNTTVTGNNSVNIGYGSTVTGNNSGAFGPGVVVSGDNLIKIGNSSHSVRVDGLLAVGTSAANNASAQVQFDSTTKGFLGPRMTTAQINAVASPAEGLQIYNLDLHTICFYNGTSWQKVTSSAM